MRDHYFRGVDPPERTADPAVRSANLRRIGRLFIPYKGRLGAVLALIVVSAGLGVIPAFLLRGILQAIPLKETTRLSYLAAGILPIAIFTGVRGGFHELLSDQV